MSRLPEAVENVGVEASLTQHEDTLSQPFLFFYRCRHALYVIRACTDKKEKKIFLIYKEIQMGSVAKSHMRKGFLIYEEMRKYLTIYEEEAVSHL